MSFGKLEQLRNVCGTCSFENNSFVKLSVFVSVEESPFLFDALERILALHKMFGNDRVCCVNSF